MQIPESLTACHGYIFTAGIFDIPIPPREDIHFLTKKILSDKNLLERDAYRPLR